MSSQSMPQIPSRPTRVHDKGAAPSVSMAGNDVPKIPPRPAKRQTNRSPSPFGDSYAPSPLNETMYLANHGASQSSVSIYNSSANVSSSELAPRPPSVSLPSVGQEGTEYAEMFNPVDDAGGVPAQTRSIANDLKLHAPKPSLPQSSVKERVSTVTRTDSGQAAAYGIGHASHDDKDPHERVLKTKESFTSQQSIGTERPSSAMEKQGIPEIGQQVPMYPNAGDVQAPSPSPFATPYASGIGFHNDGSQKSRHGRRSSHKGFEGPPGSYGLHGHGVTHHDRFEKAYYEKHPELMKKEAGQYGGAIGEERKEWALSSDDLNKIVRDTASRGSGLGSNPQYISTPSEQIGFQASEEYASRITSPKPQSSYLSKAHPNTSQGHVESPLRKTSFAADISSKEDFEGTLARSLQDSSETALESGVEDDDIIHLDPPKHPISKIYGGAGDIGSTDSFGAGSMIETEDEYAEEHGYGAPILASDEVAKEPFGYELQPAVSPQAERRGSSYDADQMYYHRNGSGTSLPGSRPSSRPGSIQGIHAFSKDRSTPLEDLEEYEPLFPEDERKSKSTSNDRPMTAADRLKRPDLMNRKFPSQDIWEDTPKSLQYTATVSTPQLPEDSEERVKALEIREGESPAQAFARRQEELAEMESTGTESFLHKEKVPWSKDSHLAAETRPNVQQRFPSRDIWEDTPDSLQLHTTVGGPQTEEKESIILPTDRPTTGAVAFHQEKSAAGLPLGSEEGRATTGIAATMRPEVPARPSRLRQSEPSTETAQPLIPERPQRLRQTPPAELALDGASPAAKSKPSLPDRAKPQVPARPAKSIPRESPDSTPLSKTPSETSMNSATSDTGNAGVAKSKPPVPSRPIGSKIAALQGGFMSDLNKRLQLGPQAPKKEESPPADEPEIKKEKAPLADARKGRARGPARRAPAKSSVPVVETPSVEKASQSLAFSTPVTSWHIHPDEGLLSVPSADLPTSETAAESKSTGSEMSNLATNTAHESLLDSAKQAPNPTGELSQPTADDDAETVTDEMPDHETIAGDDHKDDESTVKQGDARIADESARDNAISDRLASSAETASRVETEKASS